ncbi:MAG: type I restriction endonuclease subunit R [Candidatus Gracilibacteria bacterium]|jgi:type I restriction enzyme R subunit
MRFNEQYTVENFILDFFQKPLGYEYIPPQKFAAFRQFENEYVITPLLLDAVKKINKIHDDTEAQNVVREIKKIDTNEGFLNLMRNGINLKDPAQAGRMRDYFVVDFENLKNNHFVVTNQFYFEGNAENIRPDILVFLNGLPIADIEAKSPTAANNVNYEKAIDQLKRYEKNAWKLFLPNCFNVATDGLKTVYGATYSPKQHFLQWRDDVLAQFFGGELEMTLGALFHKEKLLDIIKNFILFEKEKERTTKKICRYQQYRATNLIVDRVKGAEKKRGLIWHTQGSGKSITMFYTAWKLRFDQQLKNPKIFVLVDRIDLDDQIYQTFTNCGGENVVRVTSRKDLESKIRSPERGIFISTIQKFSELEDEIKSLDHNTIVLCDEAHRDNEGVAAINLRSALQNAFFFGFTGTPIDKKTLNTHRNFGEEGERYLDYYSIQQAIEDGTTLPVTFEARLSKFFIDEEKIDQQFEEFAADLSEEQKTKLIQKYGKKASLVKLDKRMEAIAQDIVEHYKLYVEPNGFKAQIVCADREACVKYKKLLDNLIPADWSAIIYSAGDPNSSNESEEETKKYNTTKPERERMIENFKDRENPLRFLIVCDMLLTGFDAPNEQVMYLDKPLRDHNLLQAIARTNRVYPNKGCGKIIDYYGITRNLYAALDFDESIVSSAMLNIDEFKKRFTAVLDEVMKLFNGFNIEDPSLGNLRRCLKVFVDNAEQQNYFRTLYTELKQLFEILSPDPFLKEHLRKFEWLTSLFLAFTKEFGEQNGGHELAEYGEKMKTLIQENVDYEGITKNFREMRIHDMMTLQKLEKMDDEEKSLCLEKMLAHEVRTNLDSAPIFKTFSERLRTIREEFEKNQIDLAERIKKYYDLLKDIQKAEKRGEELGLDLREYGLFAISEEFIKIDQSLLIAFIKEMAKRLSELLDKNWQESSKKEEFIKEIKRIIQEMVLKEYKDQIIVQDFQKYLNRLIDVIVKKF